MPIEPRRRKALEAAVAAYEAANLFTPLPRNAARLLIAMFPDSDVYQGSPEGIATLGFSQRHLPGTLQRLVGAGFLSRQFGVGSAPDTFYLHLPPLVRR
jgi:hypothetical protein